jgi:hypothetical protein
MRAAADEIFFRETTPFFSADRWVGLATSAGGGWEWTADWLHYISAMEEINLRGKEFGAGACRPAAFTLRS